MTNNTVLLRWAPPRPEVYRFDFSGAQPPVSHWPLNRKKRYRMASPPRKPAGAQVAPLRCLILQTSKVRITW